MSRQSVHAASIVLSLLLVYALCRLNQWCGALVLTTAGVWSIRFWAARVAPGNNIFSRLMTAVFLIHVAIALALFSISYFQIPMLRSLQVGGGFWTFATDSDGYHLRAIAIQDSIIARQPLPTLGPTASYELFLAIVYLFFGTLPLNGVVINCWLVTSAGVIAAALARHWQSSTTGFYGAALVAACWPSGFIWASQLLRDGPAWLLTFGTIFAAVSLLDSNRPRIVVLARKSLFLLSFAVCLSLTRSYAGWILVASAACVLCWTVLRRRTTPAPSAVAVILVLFLASTIGNGRFLSKLQQNVEIGANLPPLVKPSEAPSTPTPSSPTVAQVDLVPRFLEQKRRELLINSSASVGGQADLLTWRRLFAFLPSAFATALYAPLPWEPSVGKSTGVFRSIASLESLLMILLSPVLVVGCVRAVASSSPSANFVFVYGMVTLILLSLVVPNLGGLVRLRPQALLPLFALAFAFGGASSYVHIARLIASAALRSRPSSAP